MARKKYEEDTENHERWLISYADFITLLFAFFVVMYAISVVNEGKYRVFSDSVGDAFGRSVPAAPNSAAIDEPFAPIASLAAKRRQEVLRRERERLAVLARKLESTLGPLVKSGKVNIRQNGRGVTLAPVRAIRPSGEVDTSGFISTAPADKASPVVMPSATAALTASSPTSSICSCAAGKLRTASGGSPAAQASAGAARTSMPAVLAKW